MFLIFFRKKIKKIVFPLFNREGCLILMPVRDQSSACRPQPTRNFPAGSGRLCLFGPLMASDTLATKFSGGIDVMKLKPLNDRVLVKRLESEEKTAGGLYIPDTAKEKPSKGQVVAVGPGKLAEDGSRIAMAVKKGDEVLFNKYAGTEVKLDGVEHLVMREEDILAIID
jgi:chaperonin GroES